ncbi:MAG: phosphoribosylamine--glycine ligase [Candidatus Omnitrophica bacterium]|nr:phosphoribosylamine--glycine ligase [Candidatus Omnitrophota bacterium]
MKILVIGSGGREHALCWKIAKSKKVDKIFCALGNGGISDIAEIVNIKADDIKSLINFVKENRIDLTVVGPEAPLVVGIVDEFGKEGLKIFGPTKNAALLESSKVFAKELMRKIGVPTADFRVFDNVENARTYVKSKNTFPVVIKADGLCAGKGVIIVNSQEEAENTIKQIMVGRIFGDSGNRIIIEDCLVGEEASILVLTDGINIIPLATSQDHKRIFDDDKGPNTGGMGAYSPTTLITEDLEKEIMEKIIIPVIASMVMEGSPYKGVLYAGIMVTEGGPFVLEFNVRFGDPETQAILPRLKGDLIEALLSSIDGTLDKVKLEWDRRSCVSVVISSGGYPGNYQTEKEIKGLDKLKDGNDIVVFHAGTGKTSLQLTADSSQVTAKYYTSGGRVLNVTALGDNIREAREKAYKSIERIHFEGMHFRKDIGMREVKRSNIK